MPPVTFKRVSRRPGIYQRESRYAYECAIGFLTAADFGMLGVIVPWAGGDPNIFVDSFPIVCPGWNGFQLVTEDDLAPFGASDMRIWAVHCDPYALVPLWNPIGVVPNCAGGSGDFINFGAIGRSYAAFGGFNDVSGEVWHTYVLRYVNESPLPNTPATVTEAYLYATGIRGVE